MKRAPMTIDDLRRKNPALAAQAEAQLAAAPAKVIPNPHEPFEHVFICGKGAEPKPKAQRHTQGRMNGGEARFARHLDATGQGYKFEALRFTLAPKTTYTPDFYCPAQATLYEVKAWWKGAGRVGWREDARIKWKMAAELFPEFHFAAVWWRADLGRFDYEWAS